MLSSVGRLVGARQAHRALDYQDGRAPVRDTLFILLTPFIRTQNGLQGAWLRTHCSHLAGWPKHPERARHRLIEVEGDRYNGAYLHLLSQRFPADSGEPLWFPISLLGLLLSFVL